MDPNEFVTRVKALGLAAKFVGGPDDRIIGGATSSLEGGIEIFQHSFAAFRAPEGMMVVVSGPGIMDQEYPVRDLAEALTVVSREYGLRSDL